MEYKIDCTTCFWNFKTSDKNVCANVYYGREIEDILLDDDIYCDDWKLSFELFCEKMTKMH